MGDRRLFALSDPHLSLAASKPMHVFGRRWDNHVERLRANWLERVGPDDAVLVPGDISWAMRLDEAMADLRWLAALPGAKVLLRGNHDYWWQGVGKMRALAPPGLFFVQNDCVVMDGLAVGGSRMWDFPGIRWRFEKNSGDSDADGAREEKPAAKRGEDDAKIRERELARLELSLGKIPAAAALKVAMTHYPPLGEEGLPTAITDLVNRHGIDICVFGHVHALPEGEIPGADIVVGGTRFVLAASDFLGHCPKLLAEF